MPEERLNPQSQEGSNMEQTEDTEDLNNERFESDTQKIIRRHLENEDDVITDEDIANIRVGMVPPEFDRATDVRFEGEEAREDLEEDLTKGTIDLDKDKNPEKGPITPWDTIDTDK
jgi:hypothetical protein